MTFVELMNTAADDQVRKMKIAIFQDGRSEYTARSYIRGERRPPIFYQAQIQRHVRRIFNQDIAIEQLFPPKA